MFHRVCALAPLLVLHTHYLFALRIWPCLLLSGLAPLCGRRPADLPADPLFLRHIPSSIPATYTNDFVTSSPLLYPRHRPQLLPFLCFRRCSLAPLLASGANLPPKPGYAFSIPFLAPMQPPRRP